jgi:hypothetical protein
MHLSMSDDQSAPGRRRGRKPRVPGQPVTRFNFELTEQEHADLLETARELGTHPSDFLREAVNEAVADFRERKLFAPGRRRRHSRRH